MNFNKEKAFFVWKNLLKQEKNYVLRFFHTSIKSKDEEEEEGIYFKQKKTWRVYKYVCLWVNTVKRKIKK